MKIVYGPPGTGKTSYLLARMEEELAAGTEPNAIAFVSFTTAAVKEALSRAKARFALVERDLPFFKTLHAICFSQIGAGRAGIMSHYRDFARDTGLRLRGEHGVDAVFSTAVGADDILLHAHQLCSATQTPFAEVVRRYGLRASEERYASFTAKLEDWKTQHRVLEYADMLEKFLAQGASLPIKVAFIDEAQDLTPQQWAVVRLAFANARELWIAGDDDQAIYHWAGADVERMLALEGETIVLGQSHRLPQRVKSFVDRIGARIEHRKTKRWNAREDEGELERGAGLMSLPLANGFDMKEKWMMLARTTYALAPFCEFLQALGLPHRVNGVEALRAGEIESYRAMVSLRNGASIDAAIAKRMLLRGDFAEQRLNFRNTQRLTRAQFAEGTLDDETRLLRDIPQSRLRFMRRVEERGAWGVNVDVSTIHQAKGAEAEHVVLSTTMSRATACALRSRSYADDEHRVWYVGASRAKKSLWITKSTGDFYYGCS